ncbi:hypothetical protein AB0M23_28365 [Streptomyces sp. NPDC052077]|uniref:hypothetical protein n=1 Tax=Streptomyces sp. NPDC052077 TaxID=3154757 RepID=UPI00343544AF
MTIPETFQASPAPAPASAAGAPAGGRRLAEVTARIQRPREQVPLYLDAEAASQIADAEAALEKAREYDELHNEPDTAPAIARHLRDLEERAEASKVVFVLQAVPHRVYQRLRTQCPPTAQQVEQAAKAAEARGEQAGEPAFDPDAFAPLLVRHQLLEPVVSSDEEFTEFWDELNDGQLNQLWSTALTVQLGVTDPGPKSELASEVLQTFGLS